MEKKYFEVRIRQLPQALEDEVSYFCFENGAAGISEDLSFVQPSLTYDPTIVEKETKSLVAFFETPPPESLAWDLQKSFPGIEVKISQEENRDWLEEWKKGFEPFQFARDFWIVPSWRPVPPEAKEPLLIDPGMAFGTGTHETTRLAAQQIFNIHDQKNLKDLTVLDVGTGTGILAMMAARLGAKESVGIDIDPECVRVARENLERNKATHVTILDEKLEQVTQKFDIVIANIIDGVLVNLKSELLRVLAPGGYLVLSGILRENADHLLSVYTQGTTLKPLASLDESEWRSFLFASV